MGLRVQENENKCCLLPCRAGRWGVLRTPPGRPGATGFGFGSLSPAALCSVSEARLAAGGSGQNVVVFHLRLTGSYPLWLFVTGLHENTHCKELNACSCRPPTKWHVRGITSSHTRPLCFLHEHHGTSQTAAPSALMLMAPFRPRPRVLRLGGRE